MINLKPLKNRVLAINYREVFLFLANEINNMYFMDGRHQV